MDKIFLTGILALTLLGGGMSVLSLSSTAESGSNASIVSGIASKPALAGCPVFHCTSGATGVMYQPIISGPVTTMSNNTLGDLKAQGCAGDGTRLACLFTKDNVTSGVNRGTLKVIDASTLTPIWGSAGVAELYGTTSTYDIGGDFSIGEVPVLFSDGTIAAGDKSFHVHYDASGRVLHKIALDGSGSNMGLTLISGKYGVVSQTDGALTLVDLNTWTKVGDTLKLSVGTTTVSLSSPSSGSGGVLYVVTSGDRPSNMGYLFSVSVSSTTGLHVRGVYTFLGSSSASPVVIAPSISGFADNLILLHVPGLVSDGSTPKNRLMGLVDHNGKWSEAWAKPIDLSQPIGVAPTIDEVTKSLYFQYHLKDLIYRYDFTTGLSTNTYDIQALASLPRGFKLNGHIDSIRTDNSFTLLLSGFVNTRNTANSGQYVVALNPSDAPGKGTTVWAPKISPTPDSYTAAWTLGPSKTAGIYCPIVVGTASGLTKICD